MPAHHHLDYLELPAADAVGVTASREFFRRAFGWEYKQWGDEYADTGSSGLNSGIGVDTPERQARPLPILYSENLEASLEAVRAAGAEITRDIFSFPGGRRFQFREPGGNELAVWGQDPDQP